MALQDRICVETADAMNRCLNNSHNNSHNNSRHNDSNTTITAIVARPADQKTRNNPWMPMVQAGELCLLAARPAVDETRPLRDGRRARRREHCADGNGGLALRRG